MSKPFWRSKTVWGAVLACIPTVGPVLSAAVLSLPQDPDTLPAVVEGVPAELQAILAGVGALLAIYGRFKASGTITLK